MNPWSSAELEHVITLARTIKGARLQEVQTSAADVCLGFYAGGRLRWLWIDLNAVKPTLLPWAELPLRLKAHKSPLNLFLRAHFVDRTLHDITVDAERGRVVRLTFGEGTPDEPSLEVRLFPHLRNVIAQAGGKHIAWQKPRDLPTDPPVDFDRPPRDLERLRDEWRAFRNAPGSAKAAVTVDPAAKLRDELARRLKALDKVTEELARKRESPWREVGDWLKTHQSLDVPAEWEPFVDRRRKLAWNIEQAFTKARELIDKTAGTETRLRTLEAEIARLREELTKPPDQMRVTSAPKANPLGAGAGKAAQGRTLRLDDDVTVVAGKSAADNLKLLRRARSWDLWMHLRDYPSSHAILFRNKNTKVGDADLLKVAAWFVKLHLGSKVTAGERFEILIAECRFVRPIKGDKIGRVTYRDERTLIFRAP